ncbi:MAG: TAT-variant-translocated molybdopterin oxidoreductase [Bacteroidota bacterium]
MASNKKYWKSEAELNPNDSIVETLRQNEFTEPIPVDEFLGDKESLSTSNTNRRDFLKYVGFSTAAAAMAACEGPVHKSIPYVFQPDNIVPGVANFYATTIADGFDFASVLIKTREGRPIKIENNEDAKVNAGANARVHASVLTLYDSTRVQGPTANGEPIEWKVLDTTVRAKLGSLANSNKQIALLTQTYASPSTERLIAEFKEKYPNTNHVVYDAISEDAALNAFNMMYGERAFADYDFEKAELIVAFGADFLGDWQGGGYDSGYAKGRIPKHGKMSKHIQLEGNMSLSGANADKRYPMTSAQQKIALAKLYGKLNGSNVGGGTSDVNAAVDNLVAHIRKAGSKAVVVTGLNDINAQMVVLAINKLLASEAFDAENPKYVRQGDSAKVSKLVADMNAGRIGALIMDGVNPAYTLPNADEFVAGLDKVDLSVSFSFNNDETAQASNYVAAASHYLESWGDVQLKKGHYALTQPAIRELFDTRQFQTALLTWMGNEKTYYEYIRETWDANILQGRSWNQALQDGVLESMVAPVAEEGAMEVASEEAETVESTIASISAAVRSLVNSTGNGTELILYSKVGMGDGKQATNPWLQEFPDPISRVSWDNYVTVSKADAVEWELENENVANGGLDGSYVKLTVDGTVLENVPVIIQPGQAKGTVGLSFGYGRKAGMKSEMATGVNAFLLYKNFSEIQSVRIEKTSGMHEFACVQLHNTLMGRGDIIKETTLEIFNTKDSHEWNHLPEVTLNHEEIPVTSKDADLWQEFDRTIGHHFNLSIDLNACTGCGACVIACHAENNVPVVGKREMRLSRDMHWLRIDRYYSSEDSFEADNEKKDGLEGLFGDNGSLGGFGQMEDPSANPQVAFQPVMCQHCNHAPCETVCPVAATSHGRQGQNHMAYNRCVGTRYCANNCPYKVRRFNWFLYNNNDEFDFNMNNDLGKMVINPDVTVRSRGVMEKCSFCIQSTQAVILKAKREGRPVAKGEFNDACACSAACTSGAMRFGDVNEEGSPISELVKDKRAYHLLEHVGTKPNVVYQVKVRNTNEA